MLEIIVGGKASGKTRRLLEEALKHPGSIVLCADVVARDHTRRLLTELLEEQGITGNEARLREQLMVRVPSELEPRGGGPLYVDNLEWVLSRYTGGPVAMVADNALVETPQGKRFQWMQDNPHANS